jgi:hypothetical protein
MIGKPEVRLNAHEGLVTTSSIKVEVKKKHISFGWNFSCFAAHLIERDLFCSSVPCARLRGNVTPVVLVFSTSGFHRLFATKPISSETSKAERRSSLATIVLFGTRGP